MIFLVCLHCCPLLFSSCLLWRYGLPSLDLISSLEGTSKEGPSHFVEKTFIVNDLEAKAIANSSAALHTGGQDVCSFGVFNINYLERDGWREGGLKVLQ